MGQDIVVEPITLATMAATSIGADVVGRGSQVEADRQTPWPQLAGSGHPHQRDPTDMISPVTDALNAVGRGRPLTASRTNPAGPSKRSAGLAAVAGMPRTWALVQQGRHEERG